MKNVTGRAEKYLAYFQAFSNTHAPVDDPRKELQGSAGL